MKRMKNINDLSTDDIATIYRTGRSKEAIIAAYLWGFCQSIYGGRRVGDVVEFNIDVLKNIRATTTGNIRSLQGMLYITKMPVIDGVNLIALYGKYDRLVTEIDIYDRKRIEKIANSETVDSIRRMDTEVPISYSTCPSSPIRFSDRIPRHLSDISHIGFFV